MPFKPFEDEEERSSVLPMLPPELSSEEPSQQTSFLSPPSELVNPIPEDSELLQAIRDRNAQLQQLNIIRAGQEIGAAIGTPGQKANTGFVESLMKQVDRPVEDVELKRQQKKAQVAYDKALVEMNDDKKFSDPNSNISKFARDIIKEKFPKFSLGEDTSAKDLEQLGIRVKDIVGSSSVRGNYQLRSVFDPTSGSVKQMLFNTATGEIADTGQLAGFATQFKTDPYTGDIIAAQPSVPGIVKSITGAKTPATKQPGQQPVVTRENLNPKQRELLDETRKSLDKDPIFEKAQAGIAGAQEAKTILKAGNEMNGDLVRAIQNKLARATGEVGVMTEQDVSAFGGRGAALDKLKRLASIQVGGKLPDSDRQFLLKFADAMEKAANKSTLRTSKKYINRFSSDTKTPAKDSMNLLGITDALTIKPKYLPGDVIEKNGKSYKLDENFEWQEIQNPLP